MKITVETESKARGANTAALKFHRRISGNQLNLRWLEKFTHLTVRYKTEKFTVTHLTVR